MTRSRSPYFLRVREIINREDPVGLIDLGAPEDEYDPEVEDLVRWRRPVDAERVTEVFVHWFGQDATLPRGQAESIAAAINNARAAEM